MAKKTKAEQKTDEKIIQRAIDCLSDYKDREGNNIRRAEEAIRFRALEQWPDAIKRDRENEHQEGGRRPCPVLDKTNQYIRQIINEERQNRAAIKIRPVDDEADPKVAEIFTGIIRHIEDQSEAIQAYTTGGEHAVDGGYGFIRLMTEYSDDQSFDQDILIKRVSNRFSVALGPHSEPDGADAKQAVVWEDMTLEDFEAEYPKAEPVNFDAKDDNDWLDDDMIRVGEFMEIVQEPMNIHLMDDDTVLNDEQFKQAQDPEIIAAAMERGIQIPQEIDSRESTKKTVHWYKMTGEQILERETLVGSYIPIVKVTGNELVMPDGKLRTSGALEAMMDPQRLHNYAHAGFIEHVALAPRAPWIAPEDAIEGYEGEYAQANRIPNAVLKYKHLDDQGNPMPPPQRTPPAGISPGWQKMLENTEHGVESSIGMYGPSVGAESKEKSGIALQEQKSQGMVGNFHFPDNLSRSIQQVGRILLEWIPEYYDRERVARILGENGDVELVKLNPNQEQAVMPEMDKMDNEIGSIYNLNIGKYDVTVATGPSYTSKRQESADFLLQVVNARPELLDVMGDKLFENMDAPGADDIAERLKTLLPKQIQEIEANKDKKPLDPKTQAALQQVDQSKEEIQQAAAMLQEKDQALTQLEQEVSAKAAEVGGDQKEIQAVMKEIQLERKLLASEDKVNKSELEILKIKADMSKHDREMDLKEYEARVERSEEGELEDRNSQTFRTMAESLTGFYEQLDSISARMDAPKDLSMERDENGELIAVNGRPVRRDGQGNLIGLDS